MNNRKVLMAELYPLIADMLENNGEVTFRVTGVSMQPMLYNKRDTVTIIKPNFPLKKYDIPFYLLDDGRFILHRIIKVHPDGTYECRGDNCWTSENNIRNDQIIGVVKSFTRNGKVVKIDKSFGYWIYTRSWKFLHYFKRFYKYPANTKKRVKLFLKYLNDILTPEKHQITRSDGTVQTITYRRAYKSDVEQIQKIMHRHAKHEIKEFNNDFINSSWSISKSGKDFLEKFIENNFIYVAIYNNEIIGYVRGRISEIDSENFPVGKCQGIFVDSDYRGMGIGKKLLESLKDYCREKNCTHLKIETLENNTVARRLYERNGFKAYSRIMLCVIDE